MKDNLAILFYVTGDHSFALATVLMGLREHSPELADRIIVYHQGISESDQRRLHDLGLLEFRLYEPPPGLRAGNCPLISYARMEGFNLLKQYRNVLCLDVDLLIRGDITDILNYRNTGIALRSEPNPLAIQYGPELENIEESRGMDLGKDLLNAGVMLLSDQLENHESMADWAYSIALREPGAFDKFTDQAVLNLMVEVFNWQVTPLPSPYNQMISRDYRAFYDFSDEALIVHTITSAKCWNFWRFKEWDRYYQNWLEMGGSRHEFKRPSLMRYRMSRLRDALKVLKKRSYHLRHPWRARAK